MLLDEIFLSLQGETHYIGVPFLFVRFSGCNIRCDYCDTPAALIDAPACHIHLPKHNTHLPNPIATRDIAPFLREFQGYWLSFTGGEPLLQANAVEEMIKSFPFFQFWIETNGTLPETITSFLRDHIAVWSMDIKPPSAVGKTLWETQQNFFEKIHHARNIIILKVVLTPTTTISELDRIWTTYLEWKQIRHDITLIFQPMTKEKTHPLTAAFQWAYQKTLTLPHGDVRIIPQVHPLLRIP